jgi:uncharacterized protein YkwD
MNFKICFLPFCVVFCTFQTLAQPAGRAAEVYHLINEARSNPKSFLEKYREEIEDCAPSFAVILEESEAIANVKWDNGLQIMCKDQVDNGNLNPVYPGKMEGFDQSTSGSGSGSDSKEAIAYLCSFYSIINDPDQTHFAIYISKGSYAFIWGRTTRPVHKKKYSYAMKPDTSKVDFNILNTGKSVKYLSDFEKKMIVEINFARVYPSVYADIVGKHMEEKSDDWDGLSRDEITAVNELIKELKSAKKLNALQHKECVYQAAKSHGLDCEKRGFTDHTGSDNSSPFERISKHCGAGTKGNENIVGSTNLNVRKSVIALLVDSGISSRGHRYNMLNPDWKFVGCYHYIVKEHEYSANFVMGNAIQNFSDK